MKKIAFSIVALPTVLAVVLHFGTTNTLLSQDVITWDQLSDVKWEETYDASLGLTIIHGDFAEGILALDGKEVTISGYVIPLDALGLTYALSRTSFASCFFCGQAGPETVMELRIPPRSVEPSRQKNSLLTFSGRLKVKPNNEVGLHYELLEAAEKK